MSAPSPSPGGRTGSVAFHALGPLLGILLVFTGGAKVRTAERFVERFGTWGLDPELIPWTGAVEIVLGLGLLFHGTRTLAAGPVALWMAGAVTVHLAAGELILAGLPLMVAGLAGIIAVTGFRGGRHLDIVPPAPLLDPPVRPLARVRFLFALMGVSFLIRWAVGGMLFWASLPVLGLMHSHAEGAGSARQRVEGVLLYLLVLGAGVAGLWGFVGHLFLADEVARSIGWAMGSPFQAELAFYHLAMGIVALLSLWIRDRYWIAAGLTPAVFALGAGVVHVRDLLRHGNTAPANWGPDVLVGNLLIPLVLLSTLYLYGRLGGWSAGSRGRAP